MAYIGNDLRSNEDYKIIDDISSGFNGSETSFALQVGGATPVPFPKFEQQLLISVNGVIQEPDPTGSAGFKLLGTNIVFSSAPTNGHAFFGVIYAGADYVNAGGTFPDGSINFPSITFSEDTNTGFTRTASGTVALISDGTKVAQFPTSQGSSGQALITDGGGNLSFGIPTNIVNANINASAAIAGTKISPDFGSQNIATTGSATIGTDLIHAGDTDTKISFSTDTISLTTNNVLRMTLTGNFIDLPDAGTLRLGNSNDLQISHGSGGASNIVHSNTSQPLNISATGAGNIAFLTNSNERMRVDSSGRLLIGTTTNTFTGVGSSRLQISGTGADTAGANLIRVSNDGGGAYLQFTKNRGSATQANDTVGAISWMGHDGTDTESYFAQILVKAEANATNNNTQGSIRFGTSNGSSVTSERMRINSDGTVAIGPNTDGHALLTLSQSASAHLNALAIQQGNTGSGSGDGLFIGIDNNADAFIFHKENRNIEFGTANTERMRIDSSGRVLIGTSSVGAHEGGNNFTIAENGHCGMTIRSSTSTSGNIYFADGTSSGESARGEISYRHATDDLRFFVAASEVARIVNGGRLFLGCTGAINMNGVTTGHTFQQVENFKWTLGLRCEQTDKVGLAIRYAAGGNDHDAIIFNKDTTVRFRVNSAGNVANANNSYGQVSDVSLKENIVDANSQWNDIKNVKVRNFNFKAETGLFTHTQIGVVAQEIETTSPKLVTENEQGTKEVSYSVLYMKAIKALQEAMARIETLESEVAALKAA